MASQWLNILFCNMQGNHNGHRLCHLLSFAILFYIITGVLNANTSTTEYKFILDSKMKTVILEFHALSDNQTVPLEVTSIGKISIRWVIEILRERS